MLAFLDRLLRYGRGRLPHVIQKLQEVAHDTGLDLDGNAIDRLDERLRGTILLGVRDVLLYDLLALWHTFLRSAVRNTCRYSAVR